MEKRLDYISVSIASVYRGIQRSNSEALAEFGMNNIHAICIYAVGSKPGISATEICKSTATDKAAVSKSIKSLIDDGYIERPILSKRAYRSGIYLTEKGKELFDVVKKRLEEKSSKVFKNVNDREFKVLVQTLNHIASNFEEEA